MGHIAYTVLKWRPSKIFNKDHVLNGLILLKSNYTKQNLKKTGQLFVFSFIKMYVLKNASQSKNSNVFKIVFCYPITLIYKTNGPIKTQLFAKLSEFPWKPV